MENKNNSLVKGLIVVFSLFAFLIGASILIVYYIDGRLPNDKDVLAPLSSPLPWSKTTLVDFFIHFVPLAAWISYKQSNWISAALWVISLVLVGSTVLCPFIVLQFLKLSPQEISQDPMYHVLLRHQNKDVMEQRRKHSSVVIARIIFSALGLLMLGIVVYTLLIDGLPFRLEVFNPWVVATVIDILIMDVVLSVWVSYKESSWISTFFWTTLLICFGSIGTCAYIVTQLFQLNSQDPLYLVLLNTSDQIEAGEKPKRAPSDRLKGA